MRKFLSIISVSNKKGFTLIELLVVLGILGILAAALLAAINPIEQLNKAQDATLEQVASEFVSADARYYTANNAQPAGCTGSAVTLGSIATCYNNLITSGELKSSFGTLSASNFSSLYITFPATGTPTACFTPTSHSVQSNSNTKYSLSHNGGTGSNCISLGGTANCDWCTQ
jgi:prepilin-type N-terminal cleavage/methylation domain-containing protein